MKVFHHNDQDGRCAAFLVGHFARMHDPKCDSALEVDGGIEFISMDYDIPFPMDTIEEGEEVWFVDFSIEPEDMMKLQNITDHILWVDHHQTSIEKYNGFPQLRSIDGVRRVGTAACVLTYKFCQKIYNRKTAVHAPLFVRLIGDRDVWAWKCGDRTKYFFRGLTAEDTAPMSEIWYKVWKSTKGIEKNGEIIEKAFAKYTQEVFKSYGFETEFHGYKCFAVNAPIWGSEYFEKFRPGYDIWMAFKFANGIWTTSLYSTTVDVSKIAKKYQYKGRRGGGHSGAASFPAPYPPFLPSTLRVV